jgi:hypothetical protein
MAGSFRELSIVMGYENEGADRLSVEYPSKPITQSARCRRCRAADVSGLPKLAPPLFLKIERMARLYARQNPCAITPAEFLDASRAIQKLRFLDGGPSSDFADDAANERVDWESYGDAKI